MEEIRNGGSYAHHTEKIKKEKKTRVENAKQIVKGVSE